MLPCTARGLALSWRLRRAPIEEYYVAPGYPVWASRCSRIMFTVDAFIVWNAFAGYGRPGIGKAIDFALGSRLHVAQVRRLSRHPAVGSGVLQQSAAGCRNIRAAL